MLFKVRFGIVTIMTGNDGRHANARMSELAVASFSAGHLSESRLPQVFYELPDHSWHAD